MESGRGLDGAVRRGARIRQWADVKESRLRSHVGIVQGAPRLPVANDPEGVQPPARPMLKNLITALVLSLAASSARAQAVAPMPAPVGSPPVMTPGFAPGTPAQPVYTPAGAGLPEVGQPGQQGAALPRSPNKRILPATAEPGLWAADGAPSAALDVGKVNVLGVVFDFGPDVKTWNVAGECARDLNEAKSTAQGWDAIVAGFSEGDKKCISARAILYCAKLTKDELQKGMRMFTRLRPDAAVEAERRAKELVREHCGDKTLGTQEDDYLGAIQSTWSGVHMRRVRQEDGK